MKNNWLQWSDGRQNTGYQKKLILQWKFFDVWLIKYKEGDHIPEHVDVVSEGYNHHRINIVLKEALQGGDFICPNAKKFLKRIYLFRPDRDKHSVTKIIKGERLVLSIGWIKKNSGR